MIGHLVEQQQTLLHQIVYTLVKTSVQLLEGQMYSAMASDTNAASWTLLMHHLIVHVLLSKRIKDTRLCYI